MPAETDRFAEFAEAVLAAVEGVEDQLRRIADALEARPAAATPPPAPKAAPKKPVAADPPVARPEPPPLDVNLPKPDDWRYALVGAVGLPADLLETLASHRVGGSAGLGPLDDVGPYKLGKLSGIGCPQLREIAEALRRAKAPRPIWERWMKHANR